MNNAVTRACAWISVVLLAYTPLAESQTLDVVVGRAHLRDVPGTSVAVGTNAAMMGPDNQVYLTSTSSRKLLRFNPVTGTVTSLPGRANTPDFKTGWPVAFTFDASGVLYVHEGAVLGRYDLTAGTFQALPGIAADTSQQMDNFAFGADGTIYYPVVNTHSILARRPDGQTVVIAGSGGTGSFSGDGGPATSARLYWPRAVTLDANGNIYFSDSGNRRIRRIDAATGIITTVAGGGTSDKTADGLPALQAFVCNPNALTMDGSGHIYYVDFCSHKVRQVNAADGRIYTIAGNGNYGVAGDGGPATAAELGNIGAFAIDANGDFYLPDVLQYRVRKVTRATGIITTVLGNGSPTFCGNSSIAREMCLGYPQGLATNSNNNLVIGDAGNHRVMIAAPWNNSISTLAQFATFDPLGMEVKGSTAYMGGGTSYGIVTVGLQSGGNGREAGTGVRGFSGDGGLATSAQVDYTTDVAFDAAGNMYFSDTGNHRIRRVDAATRMISTYAGNGNPNGPLGDGGLATAASLNNPGAIEFDPAGNLIIVDGDHFRLRKIDKNTRIITTIAGNGDGSYETTGDGGPALQASIGTRPVIAIDNFGNIYLGWTSKIRRIVAATGVINSLPEPPGGLLTPEGLGIQVPLAMAFNREKTQLYIGDGVEQVVFRLSNIPAPPPDSTPPVVTANVVGTEGINGWYRSNVQLTWSVTDPESGVSSSTGCGAATVDSDTSGITYTCTATSTGGNTTRSVTLKRDTKAPTLSFGPPFPEPDASGWNTGDVDMSFTTLDSLSGVYSTSKGSPLTFTGEGANLTAQVVVTDFAGNSATFTSPVVNIDRSAPVIEPTIVGIEGNDGWYRSHVEVSWTVTESGLLTFVSGCSSSGVNSDTAGVDFTCTATSAGGTTTRTVTIKRDATPPVVTFDAALPAADDHGWRALPVSVPFTATDAMSGVATTSNASPLAITQTGAGITGQIVATDAAGNTATFTTPAINIDGTPPFISVHVVGTRGGDDWYRSDVQITWGVHDDNSQVLTRDCENVTLTTDTAGTTYTCSGTSTGGSVSQSVTIKRDATPPTLEWSAPSPTPNAAGWYTSNVEFGFTTDDGTSGVAATSLPAPVILTEDGPGQTTQVSVWDNAGNQATFFTPPVNIDHLPPIVQPFVNDSFGGPAVWHNTDVRLHWNIAENNILTSTGCEDRVIDTDTAGTTFTCSVTSGAGTTTESVLIMRDATPPVLTFGTPSPAPNSNGWNKTNVSIPFTRSDALSGLASTSTTSPIVLSTEGADVTRQVTVTDVAGNTATFTTVPRNIDKAAPVVSLVSPANGASYGFYQDVIGDYSCTDLSLLSCVGPTANGEPVNTKTAGTRTFKVTGKDLALFTTSVTNTFTVDSLFNFDGFIAPSNEPPTLNLVTRGSLVPIRWQLPDGHGGFVTNPASFTSATVGSLTCGSATVVPYPETSGGSSGISFDAGTNTFTYNWQTSASWTGCRKLTIKLRDNTLHELRFRFQ